MSAKGQTDTIVQRFDSEGALVLEVRIEREQVEAGCVVDLGSANVGRGTIVVNCPEDQPVAEQTLELRDGRLYVILPPAGSADAGDEFEPHVRPPPGFAEQIDLDIREALATGRFPCWLRSDTGISWVPLHELRGICKCQSCRCPRGCVARTA